MTEQATMGATCSTVTPDDEILAQRVRRALTDIKPLCVLGSPFHIQVKDGVVTLRGVVATFICRQQIVRVVRNVPGVRDVCEELWV